MTEYGLYDMHTLFNATALGPYRSDKSRSDTKMESASHELNEDELSQPRSDCNKRAHHGVHGAHSRSIFVHITIGPTV